MQSLPLPGAALTLSAHGSRPVVAVATTESLIVASTPQHHAPTVVHTHALQGIQSSAFHSDTVLAASSNKLHAFTPSAPASVHTLPLPPSAEEDVSITAIAPLNPAALLLGDSQGGVHTLDRRTAATFSTLDHGDYVAALLPLPPLPADTVLSASGDGTLAAYDLRLPKLALSHVSRSFHDDLLSLALLGAHAVAGTLSGALNVYDLSFREGRVERFFGHPECVNAVLPWEDCVVTASSDGYVRVVDVLGRRLLGLLEYEMEGEGGKRGETWPVEGMVRVEGWDRPVFALQGHDEVLRFCDGAPLVDEDEGDAGGGERKLRGDEEMGKKKKRRKGKGKGAGKGDNTAAFFDDL